MRGFHVPQLLRWDDGLLASEMTVVAPPSALDFAGAYLDIPPDFPAEASEDWKRKNEEQFGEDWPEARAVLMELEESGIHMLDPSLPENGRAANHSRPALGTVNLLAARGNPREEKP